MAENTARDRRLTEHLWVRVLNRPLDAWAYGQIRSGKFAPLTDIADAMECLEAWRKAGDRTDKADDGCARYWRRCAAIFLDGAISCWLSVDVGCGDPIELDPESWATDFEWRHDEADTPARAIVEALALATEFPEEPTDA